MRGSLRYFGGTLAWLVMGCPGEAHEQRPDDSASETGEATDTAAGEETDATDDDSTEEGSTDEDTGFVPESDMGKVDTGPVDSHAEDIQPIWTQNCILYCHAQGMSPPSAQLDLFDGTYDNIVNQPSGQAPMMLIAPGNPDQSYLWRKLQGTHLEAGGEGDLMPQTGFPLDDVTLDDIEEWILIGAPP